jgi:peptidyl-prolyl cis-trans isomerase SurA
MIIRYLTRSLLSVGLAASLVAGSTGSVQAEVINRIVAEVNNDVITLQDLEDVVQRVIPVLKKKTTPQTFPGELAKARQFMLVQLILYKIEEQEFKRLKLKITREQLDQTLKRILARNNVTLEEFLVRLKKRNETLADYRREIRRHLIRQRLMRIVTQGRIIVTEQEIQDAYQQQAGGQVPAANPTSVPRGGSGSVHLAAIVVSVEPGSGGSEVAKARRLANRIYAQLKKGADFTALAKKHNPEGLRENGGDLGTVSVAMMRPQMARLIAGLAKGQFSRVIRTGRGFQIIKKIDETGVSSSSSPRPSASTAPPPPAGLTPELKQQIRTALFRRKMQQAYQKWLDEVRQRSHIKITL